MGSIELCEGDFIEFLVDGEWSPIQYSKNRSITFLRLNQSQKP